jgi:hypothetical protein
LLVIGTGARLPPKQRHQKNDRERLDADRRTGRDVDKGVEKPSHLSRWTLNLPILP